MEQTSLITGTANGAAAKDTAKQATAYMNQGNVFSNQGRYKEAVRNYADAIELRENIRKNLEPHSKWPPKMTNSLAAAYMNRGVAYRNQGRYKEAVQDYADAIELREEIRKNLEPSSEWPPQMTNSLAAAYMNRGNVFSNQGRYKEAVEDYADAIELRETLREILEPRSEWPSQMTNSLAAAYMNRGVAYRNLGRYEEAVQDYTEAVELKESLFDAGFSSVIPGLAMAFYNTLLLMRKEKPDEAEETASQASTFLEKLAGMTDINALPESWQKPLNSLEQLVRVTAGKQSV
jgi:tetratricopeptide (TPR) repeat protein